VLERVAAPAMFRVEEAERRPEIARSFETNVNPWNVEEAVERILVRDERPLTAREEEAERGPETVRFEEKVEEADETRPPFGSR
jgi:hypothetical protein